jgi:hypothetical protein
MKNQKLIALIIGAIVFGGLGGVLIDRKTSLFIHGQRSEAFTEDQQFELEAEGGFGTAFCKSNEEVVKVGSDSRGNLVYCKNPNGRTYIRRGENLE